MIAEGDDSKEYREGAMLLLVNVSTDPKMPYCFSLWLLDVDNELRQAIIHKDNMTDVWEPLAERDIGKK